MNFLHRKWWICGLLLLATTINYMDRQTLANAATRISKEFGLSQQQYGHLETGFGLAFAFGSLVFGFAAERFSVRWLYPAVLAGWSLAAVVSAWTSTFGELLLCRIVFGLFEAAHWPCALKTTFALLDAKERTLGNSILQSGASIASIFTPQIMKLLMTDDIGTWRVAFEVVGGAGLLWVVAWFAIIRDADLKPRPAEEGETASDSLLPILRSGKFWSVALIILGAQTCWHLFRVWLPKFLIQGRGYTEHEALDFTSLYYIATDAGCLAAGFLSVWLVRRFSLSAHMAKRRVYLLCSLMTCAALLILWLPKGWPLLAVILVVGAGALGLFPCYYSFVQELSGRHVARLTGLLSMWVWAVTSPMHSAFGALVDKTKSFDLGMACAGLAPMIGVLALALLWRKVPVEAKA